MRNTGFPIIPVLVLISFVIFGCGKDNSTPTSPKTQGYKVAGKAVDKNGAGIDKVTIRMFGTNYAATSTTNTAGSFGFNDVVPGSYSIEIEADNLVFKPSVTDVTVTESDIDSLVFTEVNNLIHGRVIDIITNKGIPDIPVAIQQYSPHHTQEVVLTDSKGRYEFYDLPADDYSFQLDTYWNNKGMASQTFYYLNHDAFTDRELTGPEFYMSSEILEFTTATFSKETNTVHLEWTNSKSNFCNGYVLMRYGQPFGKGNGYGDGYDTNSVFIEITSKYRGVINNAKTIYFAVYANYHVNNENFGWVTSPYSEPVSIQVAE